MARLTVQKGFSYPAGSAVDQVIPFEEVRGWLRSGTVLKRLLRYEEVVLQTERLETLTKPLATAALLRALSRGSCLMTDNDGNTRGVGVTTLAALCADLVKDRRALRSVFDRANADLEALAASQIAPRTLKLEARPVYLRGDLVFGLEAGGSVGHIAGVLNNLSMFSGRPVFVTTDIIPTVDSMIDTDVVAPNGRFRDFTDVPLVYFNQLFLERASVATRSEDTAFIYQRYSAYNYVGAALASRQRVPFVLEYNGSEVWINRHWGRPLKYEELAERIELLNLRLADVVVVVSDVMRDELLERGVDSDKILVNPNGVDPDAYSPDVDGHPVRNRLGVDGDYVIGFIGTFGRWHGPENLAAAFNELMDRRPELRERTRLLMIGDGVGLSATREIIENGAHADRVIFTGRVPQAEGPSYLAACDMLVSPHVPNPDGSRFFGSPTKLFEYMAMGKPIVASSLDQIAEVLDDGRTAVMVKPGDVDSLVDGMERVIDDPRLASRIGPAARRDAVDKHTWQEHTRRIIEALQKRCG